MPSGDWIGEVFPLKKVSPIVSAISKFYSTVVGSIPK